MLDQMKVIKCQIINKSVVDQTVFDHFEPTGENEPNCSEVMVAPDMTPEDVAWLVLEKVNGK